MDSNFDLGRLGWFEVQNVEPNDFLNEKLESDKYGIYYSVKFVGDADTHLWMAKTAPKTGEKVYGHIELAKSGKSTKFKRASKDNTPQEASVGQGALPTAGHSYPPKDDSTQESIARSVALKAAVDYAVGPKNATMFESTSVLEIADKFLAWLTNSGSRGTTSTEVSQATNEVQNPVPAAPTQSGYEQAKARAAAIRERQPDGEDQSLYNSIAGSEQYDINDLPPEYR